MVQGRNLISHIKRPENIRAENLAELEALKEQYPWFAAPHITIAKAHKNENRFSYQSLLKKASLYATNRELLYEFINRGEEQTISTKKSTDSVVKEIKTKTPEKSVPVDKALLEDKKELAKDLEKVDTTKETKVEKLPPKKDLVERETIEKPPVKSKEPVETATDTEVTKEKPASREEKAVDPRKTEVKKIDKEIDKEVAKRENESPEKQQEDSSKETEPVYDPIKELRQFVKDDAEDADDIHHDLIPPSVYDPEKELLKLIDSESVKDDEEEVEEKLDKSVSVIDKVKDEKLEETESEHIHGFLDWLDDISPGEEEIEAEENELELDKKSAEKLQAKDLEPEVSKHEKDVKAPDPQNLLDEFIKNRPTMRRMKKDFYSPQNMAKKSLRTDFGLVSETLARLHLKQGRPAEAIEIYKQLKLQNPKNIAYFAARIEEIQEQIEKEND